MSELLVSGGIFLAVVGIPWLSFRLYKKFAGKCGTPINNFFFCCRRRANREGNFLRKKIVPRVELDFSSTLLRVGETVSFRVIFPICRHRTLQIVQDQPQGQPSLQESVYLQEEYELERLTIEIVKVSGETLSHRIVPIRELLPRRGPDVNEDVLLVKFLVQEAGFYQINIKYEEEHVPGSPFSTPFNPANLDPEKTQFLRDSPILIVPIGEVLAVCIRPMDRYGNECNFGDVDPNLFNFQLFQIDSNGGAGSKIPVDYMIFNFTREIKKIVTEFMTEPFEETLEVRMETEVFQPGIYQGVVTYSGVVIQNGIFDVVTLSQEENATLKTIMSNNPASKYHEAKIISIGQELQKKSRQVYVYVASKTLTIKEFYFAGLIPFRLATYRILPATKLQILPPLNLTTPSTAHSLEISDRIQPNIVLEMENCRLVIAMFALFLKQRLGGSESFENKQKFFYEELKASKEVMRTTTIVLAINRSAIVNSTLTETKNFSTKDWLRNFKIKFVGEEGSDDGGLRREWLHLLCKELFDNNTDGMFCCMGNSRLVHPNPNRDHSKWTLKHYELAAKVVGKCLYETALGGYFKQMVNARFSRSFLGQLIGFMPNYKLFEQDDPELFVSKVKYLLETDVTPLELNFTEEEYSSNGQLLKVVELLPNGKRISVNNDNKEDYLNLLAKYRLLTRVKRETEAFMKSLNEIVPETAFLSFDENELEILMCGQSDFSVDDLKINHIVSGEGSLYDKIIPWFWIALRNMTLEERSRLLQFTTGSSLLPHGGFVNLEPKFRITVYDTVGKLPIAHCCFSEICLSLHHTFEDFEKSLRIAITEGNEGFGIN